MNSQIIHMKLKASLCQIGQVMKIQESQCEVMFLIWVMALSLGNVVVNQPLLYHQQRLNTLHVLQQQLTSKVDYLH